MSKWQKISIVLGGLLAVSCLAMAGVGVLWFVNAGGSSVLAAMTGQTSTPTAPPTTVSPTSAPTTAATAAPQTQSGNGLRAQAAGTFGVVSAVNGSQITLAGARGASRTVTIGAQTRVIIAGQPNATASDIKAGDRLLVIGQRNGTNGLQPRAVIDAPAGYNQTNIRTGQIQSVSGTTLMLTTAQGPVTVEIDGNTRIFAQTLQPIQATALATGNGVIVIGQPNGDGTLSAQLIIGRAAGTGVRGRNANPPAATPTPGQ